MTYVKICGLRSPGDAEFAVRQGADAIGLAIHPPSPRHVSLDEAREIAAAVRGQTEIVAFVVDPNAEFVNELIDTVQPDVLQFHGSETESFCASFGHRYWKAVPVRDDESVARAVQQYGSAEALLLETPSVTRGGSGKTFDWSLIPAGTEARVLLAGGLAPDNVADAIRAVAPWGVDVSSGVESSRGVKSRSRIADFLEAVRSA